MLRGCKTGDIGAYENFLNLVPEKVRRNGYGCFDVGEQTRAHKGDIGADVCADDADAIGVGFRAGFEKCNCSDDIERHLVDVIKGEVLEWEWLPIAENAVAMSAQVKGECPDSPARQRVSGTKSAH